MGPRTQLKGMTVHEVLFNNIWTTMNQMILLIQSCLTHYKLSKQQLLHSTHGYPLALRNTVPNQADYTMVKRSSLLKNLSCVNRQGEKKENRQKQKNSVHYQHKWRNRAEKETEGDNAIFCQLVLHSRRGATSLKVCPQRNNTMMGKKLLVVRELKERG